MRRQMPVMPVLPGRRLQKAGPRSPVPRVSGRKEVPPPGLHDTLPGGH